MVADLYAGSGAMGIEALSRGAAKVYFVDTDPACLAAAKSNLEPLQLEGEAVFVRANLPVWHPPRDLDLVLADPPYGPLDLASVLHDVVAERVIIENDRHMDAPRRLARDQDEALRHYARNDVGTQQRGRRVTVGLIPGSFDPFHNGHLEIVERAARSLTRSSWRRFATPKSPSRSLTWTSAAR